MRRQMQRRIAASRAVGGIFVWAAGGLGSYVREQKERKIEGEDKTEDRQAAKLAEMKYEMTGTPHK